MRLARIDPRDPMEPLEALCEIYGRLWLSAQEAPPEAGMVNQQPVYED